MSILHINSSIFGQQGQTSLLAENLANQLAEAKNLPVVFRDLNDGSVGHLSLDTFTGFSEQGELTDAQKAGVALSDELIKEVQDAEVVVLTAPMYNFSVPSQLKAWVDHIARAGVTFAYTSEGPKGKLTGKKVYVVSARGGFYAGTENDVQTSWLKMVLGFMGMDDVEFIYAEGLARTDKAEESLVEAKAKIDRIAAKN